MIQEITQKIHNIFEEIYPNVLKVDEISVFKTKNNKFGDYTFNTSFLFKNKLILDVKWFLEQLKISLEKDRLFSKIEISSNNYINFFIHNEYYVNLCYKILNEKQTFGKPKIISKKILLEFVSANPTGPLHFGHARGIVLGNVLANVLKFSGHQVTKEYYLNDAGQKILNLVWTVRLLANSQPLWQDAYKGDYLLDFANKIKETRPELVSLKQKIEYVSENEFIPTSHVDDKELANICIKEMMNSIQETLKSLNVIMDSYVSEKSLLHKTQNIIELLKNKNEITSHENAVFFQTKDFLEKERVLQKSNGEYTYFANDIVYHLEKYNKNYDYLINVWGADHHGYVSRLKSAIKSLNQDPNKLEILLLQMVKFIKNGKSITFSKTEGNVITIDEILGEINESAHNPNAGRDALIYFLLSRSHDSQLDVDIDLLKTRSMDNPVFYAQMMHARMHQIIEKANNSTEFKIIKNFNELNRFSEYSFSIEEKEMLLLCEEFSNVISNIIKANSPHLLVFWIQNFAQKFASYYTVLQKIHKDSILPSKKFIAENQNWVDLRYC